MKRKLKGYTMTVFCILILVIQGGCGKNLDGSYTADVWYRLTIKGDECVYSNAAYGYSWKGQYTLDGNVVTLELIDGAGKTVEKQGKYDEDLETIEIDGRIFIKN